MNAVTTNLRNRHFVVFQRPFLHVADAVGDDAVDDELGVVQAAEELLHERVGAPDFFEQRAFAEDLGRAGDADLIVFVVEIAQLDLGIGRNLLRLVIAPQVGHVDGEPVGPHRRNGPQPGLIAID